MRKFCTGLFLFVSSFQWICAQETDSLQFQDNADSVMVLKSLPEDKIHQFSYKKLIIPTVLISYGIASLSFD
ncbi:MAG: hypothetical protein JNN23_21015, partial [Chryseobacterium gambrini]|nr:hypothetical protein [Chryseobacterium gambrini]